MTNFSVEFTDQAADDLGEITKTIAQRILDTFEQPGAAVGEQLHGLGGGNGAFTPQLLEGQPACGVVPRRIHAGELRARGIITSTVGIGTGYSP